MFYIRTRQGSEYMRLMEIADGPMQTHCNLNYRPATESRIKTKRTLTAAHCIVTCVKKRVAVCAQLEGTCHLRKYLEDCAYHGPRRPRDNLNDILLVVLGYTQPCGVAITSSHISRLSKDAPEDGSVGKNWARVGATGGIARGGEWANARGCPGGKYKHYTYQENV